MNASDHPLAILLLLVAILIVFFSVMRISTEEEAAEAYDVAAIKFRGANAVTNFELSRYDVEAIANTELPIGASAKRIKQSLQSDQDQLPLDKSDKGQHLNFVPATLFHNLMQFQGPSGFSPCLRRPEHVFLRRCSTVSLLPDRITSHLMTVRPLVSPSEVGWDSEKPGYVGLIEVANHLMIKGKNISETERSAVFRAISFNSVDLADGSSCSSGVFVERCKYLEESKCLGVCVNTCKLPTQVSNSKTFCFAAIDLNIEVHPFERSTKVRVLIRPCFKAPNVAFVVNIFCLLPFQTFFKDYMGVPLYMEPNFSDYSCQVLFPLLNCCSLPVVL
ncbi:hypothetical protein B296_00025399 [Ensete ventricosum]|uniref:AP2/ERF domain-containing protein n=1 Tax=Ensete ventricosum TaxID=4639 RepID=A0A427AIE9_ENSVE|nr:hypothetical protein B296_00025399 [Ensete ventricosum]